MTSPSGVIMLFNTSDVANYNYIGIPTCDDLLTGTNENDGPVGIDITCHCMYTVQLIIVVAITRLLRPWVAE